VSLSASQIRKILADHSLSELLPESSLEPLVRFTQKMLEVNQTLNLTKWVQPEDVLRHHILDSAFGIPSLGNLKPPASSRWMDLGTGGGFPGALVAAAFPELDLTFVDSMMKKSQAVQQALNAAGWKSKVVTARAEDLGRSPATRASWDGVTARAVADLPVLLEYAMPLLKVGGYLVNWMTEDQIQELGKSQKALDLLHAKILEKRVYQLPGLSKNRWILIVEKLEPSPDRYPRLAGQPSKRPL